MIDKDDYGSESNKVDLLAFETTSSIHDSDENNNVHEENLLMDNNMESILSSLNQQFQSNCVKAIVYYDYNPELFRSNYGKLLAIYIVMNKEMYIPMDNNIKKLICLISKFNSKMKCEIRLQYFKDKMSRKDEDSKQTIFWAFDGFKDDLVTISNEEEENNDAVNETIKSSNEEEENNDAVNEAIKSSNEEEENNDAVNEAIKSSNEEEKNNDAINETRNEEEEETDGSNEEEDSSNEVVDVEIEFSQEELTMLKENELYIQIKEYDITSMEYKKLLCGKYLAIQKYGAFISKYNEWLSCAIFTAVLYILKKRVSGLIYEFKNNDSFQPFIDEIKDKFNSIEKYDVFDSSNANFNNQIATLSRLLAQCKKWSDWHTMLTNGDYWDDELLNIIDDDEEYNKVLTQHIDYDALRLLLLMFGDYINFAFTETKDDEGNNILIEKKNHSFSVQLQRYSASTSKDLDNVSRKINWNNADLDEGLDERIIQIFKKTHIIKFRSAMGEMRRKKRKTKK
jgi:hypothetical protein